MFLGRIGRLQWRFAIRRYSIRSVSARPRIAVVGSGPAGLYVCAPVLRALPSCQIDIFERSPVPFGLIRFGVAPDHPEVKNCIHQLERIFHDDRVSLFCNVEIGRELSFDELCKGYDAVVLAFGAQRPKPLKIIGAEAKNVFSGNEFVSWYNAVPNSRSPLLDGENAVVIGQGNVALDCTRILLGGVERLKFTDTPTEVLDALNKSAVRRVSIVGRRGPLQVSFTIKELRELIRLPGVSTHIDLDNDPIQMMDDQTLSRPRKRITELLASTASSQSSNTSKNENQWSLLFNRTPLEVLSDSEKRVKALCVHHSSTDRVEILECSLLIYSIGYENIQIPGVPVDSNGRDTCRVDHPHYRVYASGWCSHNPNGVIVNTQNDSAVVAEELLSDLEKKKEGKWPMLENLEKRREGEWPMLEVNIAEMLKERAVTFLDWSRWLQIDAEERKLGETQGRLREKLTKFDRFLQTR